jgi:hypothetical protein
MKYSPYKSETGDESPTIVISHDNYVSEACISIKSVMFKRNSPRFQTNDFKCNKN